MLTPHYVPSSKSSAGFGPSHHAPRGLQQPSPAASSRHHHPHHPYAHHHDPHVTRSASSIYSQPSLHAAALAAAQLRDPSLALYEYSDPNDVSPPSSPDALFPRYHVTDAHDVSPIEDDLDHHQLAYADPRDDQQQRQTPPPSVPAPAPAAPAPAPGTGPGSAAAAPAAPSSTVRSHIPTLRRERRQKSDIVAQQMREQKSHERLKKPRPYGSDVRWDPRTGEPTTHAKGARSQVNPHEYVHDIVAKDNTAVSPKQVKQAQQSPSAMADRVRRMRQPPDSETETPSRPEWRGASGRAPLVAPVKDNLNVAPLRVPPKSAAQIDAASPRERDTPQADAPAPQPALEPLETPSRQPATPSIQTGLYVTPGSASPSGGASASARASPTWNRQALSASVSPLSSTPSPTARPYPSPPLSADHSASARAPLSVTIPSNEKATRRKPASSAHTPRGSLSSAAAPAPEHPQSAPVTVGSSGPAKPVLPPAPDDWVQPASRFSTTTCATVATEPSFADLPPPPPAPPVSSSGPARAVLPPAPDDWVQPPSRFSTTTYATSRNTDSPRQSLDSTVPPLPTTTTTTTTQPFSEPAWEPKSSVLNRGRPVASAARDHSLRSSADSGVINLSNVNVRVIDIIDSSQKEDLHKSSLVTPPQAPGKPTKPAMDAAEKDLPMAPPETESVSQDRVAQLNARLGVLGNRRINLNKAIKQMTELMPADHVLASDAVLRKREDEKRKIETLRTELAEVDRECYDLGIKLHRAYKRLDREAEFEPTTLWVRRVTH